MRFLIRFCVAFTLLACSLGVSGLHEPSIALAQGEAGKEDSKEETSKEPAFSTITLRVQDVTRTAYLFVPSHYSTDSPMPLVMAFHGYLGSGRQMMRMTGFNAIAEREGFLVVYPDAIKHKWHANLGESEASDIDVDYAKALIQSIKSSHNVDPHRVYATGFSSGGFFSERLACELPDEIAAIGTIAATIGKPVMTSCQNKRPIPVFLGHGTDDPVVTWRGQIKKVHYAFKDSKIASVPETVSFWLKHNQCLNNPQTTLQIHASHGAGIQLNSYPNCLTGGALEQLIVQKGGHTWPGSPEPKSTLVKVRQRWLTQPLLGITTYDIKASEVIWDFFKRHPLTKPEDTVASDAEIKSIPDLVSPEVH